MELEIIDESDPFTDTFFQELVGNNPDSEQLQRFSEAELDGVKRKLDWIKDLIHMVQLIEVEKGTQELSLKEFIVDLHSSVTILSLKFDNRVPKTFSFKPRSFLNKDYLGSPMSYETVALSICSTGLIAMLRQDPIGKIGTVNSNDILVEVAFAKEPDRLLMTKITDNAIG